MKKNKYIVLELFILFHKPQRLVANWKMFGLRTIFLTKLRQDLSNHRTTQHGGREGEQEQEPCVDCRIYLCVLLPLENLLWAKLRDYAISRVNTSHTTDI